MWFENYNWNYDYSQLALDQGFTFGRHQSASKDKHKIALIDIESIISNNDIGSIEKLLAFATQYSVDGSEQLLDQNFVKIFRICQLAIEYLLFCKKYLDGTIPLLKNDIKQLTEENKDLKLFNEDLKKHVNTLVTKLKCKENICVFKCDKCPKAFSSEAYLSSHKKRRHASVDAETINLESEMKELKQKLNLTEQLIDRPEDNSKVSELGLKLEALQSHVEHELRILRMKNECEEKYSKMFYGAMETLKKEHGIPEVKQSRNSITQTEDNSSLMIIPPIIEKHLTSLHEHISTSMTNSLKNIELQMQSLWKKLKSLEEIKDNDMKSEIYPTGDNLTDTNKNKPKIKKRYNRRSIFKARVEKTEKEDPDRKDIEYVSELIIKDVENREKMEKNLVDVKEVKTNEESDSETYLSSQSESENELREDKSDIKLTDISTKRVQSEKSLSLWTKEVESKYRLKLREYGLSDQWKGIPKITFRKTMDLIRHHTSVNERKRPHLRDIRKRILKNVEAKTREPLYKTKNEKLEEKPKITRKITKTINTITNSPSQTVEIKNRELFLTTDSSDDDDKKKFVKKIIAKPELKKPYSAVIKELKANQSRKEPDKLAQKEDLNVKTNDNTIRVVPQKKKVIFEEEESNVTSIDSSILDISQDNKKNKRVVNSLQVVEHISDFDYSEL